jgi:hypothetical protein
MSAYEEMFDMTENMCLAMDHFGNDEEEGIRKKKNRLSTCSYSCNIMIRVTTLHLWSTTIENMLFEFCTIWIEFCTVM